LRVVARDMGQLRRTYAPLTDNTQTPAQMPIAEIRRAVHEYDEFRNMLSAEAAAKPFFTSAAKFERN
jgi:hypothetical protein